MNKYLRNILFYCILFLGLHTFCITAQHKNIKFDHLKVEDGLSQNTINCIYKDREGFMWFGTDNGLNKYDGYEFTIYQYNSTDATSISGNLITTIKEDYEGNLWVGTQISGLNIFDKQLEKFINYTHNIDDTNSISSNSISHIFEDADSNLWIGTFGGGINCFQRETNTFKRFIYDSLNPNSIGSNYISSINQDSNGNIWLANNNGYLIRFDQKREIFKNYLYDNEFYGAIDFTILGNITIDSKDNIWIGTGNGIYIFDSSTERFNHITSDSESNTLNNNTVTGILEFKNDLFFITTDHGGINIYDRKKNTFSYLLHNIIDKNSISNNQVYCIYKDIDNNCWVGNFNGGINVFYENKKKFEVYKQDPTNNNSLSFSSVLCFYEDNQGNIWIGTDGGGLNIFNPQNKTFKHFKHNPNDENSLSNNIVTTIFEDKNGNIWIGTYRGGLNLYDKENSKFIHYRHKPDDENSLVDNTIWAIAEYSDNLWIGTGVKLNLFDKNNKFKRDIEGLGSEGAMDLLMDSKHNLWLATASNGVYRLVGENNSFIHYTHKLGDSSSIISNRVYDICEDRKGNIWFGSAGGLSKFNTTNNTFSHYTKKNGLPDNSIKCIIEDINSTLWIGTNSGFSKFNPANNTFRNFNISDGLPSNDFNNRACLVSKSGKIYFGGPKGFISFFPDEIKDNTNIPKIVFTGFSIFNEPVSIQKTGSPLCKHINYSESIKLTYKQSVFTINYAALSFISSEKNQYAYIMERFDKNWRYVGKERKATYTNLDPGEYIFRVKASNNDGAWNEEGISINIIITPPFWATRWFRIFGILFLAGVLYGVYYIRVSSIQRQKNILQQMVSERTEELSDVNARLEEKNEEVIIQKEEILSQNDELIKHREYLEEMVRDRTMELEKSKNKAEESDRLKTAFLTNMSHEIRTPMNAIIGFSSVLNDPDITNKEREDCISQIISNGNTLTVLVDDILDFSLIELNQLIIRNETFHVNEFIKKIFTFYLLSYKREKLKIRLNNKIEGLDIRINSDDIRIKQILNNLLSNAFKFTKEGFIELGLEKDDHNVIFYIKDTGIGISKENIKVIFERFRKVEDDINTLYRGVGLGLAISKKLAELLGGKLLVESEFGIGSTFYFSVPQGNISSLETLKKEDMKESNTYNWSDKKVLVAEDEESNFIYIKMAFKGTGISITHAKSGKEAIEYFLEDNTYDLVIMDIKMPEMNGYDATIKIKELYPDQKIVALTAYANSDKQQNYRKFGFNDYITKPLKKDTLLRIISKHL